MKKLLKVALLVPFLAAADPVPFEGYEAYYATLADRLFDLQNPATLEPYSVAGTRALRFGTVATAGGHSHQIEVRPGAVVVDGRGLRLKAVHVFPNEVANDGSLGLGTLAYLASGWACLENTPSSASGTAVRHKSVYLIRLRRSGLQAWKLPSLFASCTGVRHQNGQVRFDKVEYRYKYGEDFPAGVSFREYLIRPDNSFAPTGKTRTARFAEPDNVYKFSLD